MKTAPVGGGMNPWEEPRPGMSQTLSFPTIGSPTQPTTSRTGSNGYTIVSQFPQYFTRTVVSTSTVSSGCSIGAGTSMPDSSMKCPANPTVSHISSMAETIGSATSKI